MVENKVYTIEDLMELLRVKNPRTIYRWIAEDKLKAVKISRRWYIPADEVQRLLKEGWENAKED